MIFPVTHPKTGPWNDRTNGICGRILNEPINMARLSRWVLCMHHKVFVAQDALMWHHRTR